MPRISHYKTDFIAAEKVRQAVSMAKFKPVSTRMYSNEYRLNGCGYNAHSHFYVKGVATAEHVPAVLVVFPYRLDQLQPVIDSVPDAELCKADSSAAFIKFPRYNGDKSCIGYSLVFRHQRAVGAFAVALQNAIKSGKVTGEAEPSLHPDQVFAGYE